VHRTTGKRFSRRLARPVLDVLGDDGVPSTPSSSRVRDRFEGLEPSRTRRDLQPAPRDIWAGSACRCTRRRREERAHAVKSRSYGVARTALISSRLHRHAHSVLRFRVRRREADGIASRPLTKFAGGAREGRSGRRSSRSGIASGAARTYSQSKRGRLARQKCAPNRTRRACWGRVARRSGRDLEPGLSRLATRKGACTSGFEQLLTMIGVVRDRAAHVLIGLPTQHLLDAVGILAGSSMRACAARVQDSCSMRADHVTGRLVAADEDEQRPCKMSSVRAGRRRPRRARARS